MNVFRSCRTFCFFADLFSGVYAGLKNSIFVRFIIVFANWFSESVIYKVMLSAMKKISDWFRYSYIYKILYRNDRERFFMDGAAVYRLWDRISSSVIKFSSKIYDKLFKLNRSSLNFKVFNHVRNSFSLSYENILGLIMILIVIIPASIWNNIYGLILAVISCGMYFIGCISGKKYSTNIRGVGFLMLMFIFSSVVAIAISLDVKDSIRVFMFFVTSFAFMLSVGGAMNTEEKLNKFLGFIYAGVVITSVICVFQAILGIESDLLLVDTATSGDIRRAFSTFENPNNYAEYLVLFIPFMTAFALNRETMREKTLFLSLLILPVGALILTYSRSCWVTFAISAVIFILLYNYKLIPYICLIVLLAIPFLPETVWQRILTIGSMSDSSNLYRVHIWTGCVKMLKDWWITGTGLGPSAFAMVYPTYAQSIARSAPHSHMLFLELLLEMGILGGLSFILWWITSVKRMITALIRKKLNGRKIKNILIAAISSLTAITFVSGVEYIWFYPRVMIMFFVAAGIVMAAMSILRKE